MILHVLKQMQAMVSDDPGLIQEQINAIETMPTIPSAAETWPAKAERNNTLHSFLMESDRTHYGLLLIDMENSYLQQINQYPTYPCASIQQFKLLSS